jgi:cytoskeletal protein CcmA (bactofilin family)
MAQASNISAKTVIRGRIVADGHLEIHGHVEGHIEAKGDITIGDGALVKSDVQGHRVVVAGAVSGNLQGAELVVLERGARVVGDLSAPSVGIRAGALVRGHVDAGGDGTSPKVRSGRTEVRRPVAARPSAPAHKAAAPQKAKPPAKPAGKPGKPGKKAPPAPVIPRATGSAKKAAGKKRAGEAPPPVVPRAAAKRRTTAKRRAR